MKPWKFVSLVVGLVACGEEPKETHEESPEADGCEHMTEGPYSDLVAAATQSDAVLISDTHTKTTVTLAADPDGDQNIGYLSLENAEDNEYFFFFAEDVPFRVLSGTEDVASERSEGPLDECSDDVLKAEVFDLEVGTYVLEFGPADAATVDVVYLPNESHAHEDDHND